MAENEWLNGYLEAILDVGTDKNGGRGGEERSRKMESFKKTIFSGKFDDKFMSERLLQAQKEKPELKLFSPTKYFVEEVVNSFDETDLHRTWIKVSKRLYGFSKT